MLAQSPTLLLVPSYNTIPAHTGALLLSPGQMVRKSSDHIPRNGHMAQHFYQKALQSYFPAVSDIHTYPTILSLRYSVIDGGGEYLILGSSR